MTHEIQKEQMGTFSVLCHVVIKHDLSPSLQPLIRRDNIFHKCKASNGLCHLTLKKCEKHALINCGQHSIYFYVGALSMNVFFFVAAWALKR